MMSLLDVVMRGMAATSDNGKQCLVNLLPTSYIADLSKTKDLQRLKRGSQTASPCPKCLVKRKKWAN